VFKCFFYGVSMLFLAVSLVSLCALLSVSYVFLCSCRLFVVFLCYSWSAFVLVFLCLFVCLFVCLYLRFHVFNGLPSFSGHFYVCLGVSRF